MCHLKRNYFCFHKNYDRQIFRHFDTLEISNFVIAPNTLHSHQDPEMFQHFHAPFQHFVGLCLKRLHPNLLLASFSCGSNFFRALEMSHDFHAPFQPSGGSSLNIAKCHPTLSLASFSCSCNLFRSFVTVPYHL